MVVPLLGQEEESSKGKAEYFDSFWLASPGRSAKGWAQQGNQAQACRRRGRGKCDEPADELKSRH
jgi:hypothetical protein